MIATMTDEQLKRKIQQLEGAPLLALFMALYTYHINGKRLKEEPYEMIKAKIIERLTPKIKPPIVCLCGSTRFSEAFQTANLQETLAGKIVLSIGCNMKSDTEIFGHLPQDELNEIKKRLDELHKRKIDLADEVLILNVGGYVGESTQSELDYAIDHGKIIRFWEGK